MNELNNEDLKLLFDEDIYLIKEDNMIVSTIKKEENTPVQMFPDSSILEEEMVNLLPLTYKGDNKKGIVILVNNDANNFLNADDELFLLHILKAINLALKDVAIINEHTAGTNWKSEIKFDKAIAFGVLPSTYGFFTGNYNIVLKDGVKWLFSDSLLNLSSNKMLKRKLWNKLQEMF